MPLSITTHPESSPASDPAAFRVYGAKDIDRIPELQRLSDEARHEMRVVSSVLPFRVNRYVIENLIDWDAAPDDPMFRLTIPQREMLDPETYSRVETALATGDKATVDAVVFETRRALNPHPAGQQELNAPWMDGERVEGLQHKYAETVLLFPSQGQTCHSYCTFCFRWAQFVNDKELKMAVSGTDRALEYLARHKEVSDLLMTGGDPMVMNARRLGEYLTPMLEPRFDHIQTIRIGTKSLTFWPHRFVTDKDADDVLRLIETLVDGGKHVALMAHYEHSRELETDVAKEAIRRVQDAGAVIRSQAPVLRTINDSADVWAELWEKQVQLGIVPYYMFMERDTGARHYFEVPIARALEVYRGAMRKVSGLGRTARGPVMSAGPGKVHVQGVAEVAGEKVFVLSMLQGRHADWCGRTFFAKYDRNATWLTGLKPALGEQEFFFEPEYREMLAAVARDGA